MTRMDVQAGATRREKAWLIITAFVLAATSRGKKQSSHLFYLVVKILVITLILLDSINYAFMSASILPFA
jgi:hypothetical protein